jgi:prepilin peptidase CpaA
MGGQTLLLGLHGILAILLGVAIVTDVRSRIIDNWLNATIALLAPVMWVTISMSVWPDMAFQIGVAALVFGVCAGFFALNLMGGGDVKLLGALALWFPLKPLIWMLINMSVIGGLLTIVMLIRHKMSKSDAVLEIPYGVAIALAALWTVYERYLNHFG